MFVSPPTGSVKSLCYTVLPMMFDRLKRTCVHRFVVIVVSPLIALMKDKVCSLCGRGVRSAYVGEINEHKKHIYSSVHGELSIMFMSPELLLCDIKWRDILQSPV